MKRYYGSFVKEVGELIVYEIESLVNVLKVNWRQFLGSLIIGLFVYWFLNLSTKEIVIFIEKSSAQLPPLIFILVVEALLLIIFAKKFYTSWNCYRKSYFNKNPPAFWVDLFLIVSLFVFFWIKDQIFVGSSYFRYCGILFIFFTLITYFVPFICSVKSNYNKIKKGEDKLLGKTELFSDEPIYEYTDDLIGRSNFAQSLKENIYNLSFKESFVMALYGKWGEGKTSIINLLKAVIKKEGHLLVYEFTPWFFGSEDALITNFYRGLEDCLSENYLIPNKVKRLLKFYPEILIKGFANIDLNFQNKNEEDRPGELKKSIEDFIVNLDKKVLVVIDDVDRLQKDEILAVFKLIKLTSHIKNLVFLISFDIAGVINALKDAGFDRPENYLEKIVQLPINLPMTDPGIIDKFLLYSFPVVQHKSEIDKLFDRLEIDPIRRAEFDKEFPVIYQSHLKQIFSTFRAAKRYLNSILFRLPFIEREVYLYDFFLIEVVQTFFPALYADMKSSPWYYFSKNTSFETMFHSSLPYDEKQRRQEIKVHIMELIKDSPYSESIQSLLKSIFPEVKSAFLSTDYSTNSADSRANKRVSHAECYFKYFMLGTKEGIISDAEYEDLVKSWQVSKKQESEIEKDLFGKYQTKYKLVQLLEKIKLHSFNLNQNVVLPIIDVLYKNSNRLQKEGGFWMTEFDQADGVIFRLVEDRVKKEEIKSLIEKIIKETPALDFASLFVLTCTEGRGGSLVKVRSNVDIGKLRSLLDERLTGYFIRGGKNIFREYPTEREFAFILYQWATNWASTDSIDTTKQKVTDYLLELFKKESGLIDIFLKHYIKDNQHNKEKYFDYEGFVIAYNPEKFANFFKTQMSEIENEIISLFFKKHNAVAGVIDTGQIR